MDLKDFQYKDLKRLAMARHNKKCRRISIGSLMNIWRFEGFERWGFIRFRRYKGQVF